ncbi:hypothetical protein SNE25_21030 [Mucilaginibacter sabulilitoris]|uniref:Uncharacterized protein n=1 Tax=Mucilaginibacter sabulilitoris TaxID=1173583 RepID=A0ABZ0TJT6_9SPHI|nr:hypothetical protein [Mucilaginibacter sabulilitoris]WPU91805.1 hypothetical protein SNE25_21030 [Mucilaginibacter sabulilitoris]
MAPRKPYNPNTQYGRKKIRDENQAWLNSLPPEEIAKINVNNTLWYVILLIIVGIIIYAVSGPSGLLHWASH